MTTLKLYNTLTREKEDFKPIDPSNVRLYVCGPTVYDFAHIGNARPVIVFDVLYRLLRHLHGESHVTYVRNITDVDDKINARALRDFPDLPLNEAIRKVTEKTANQFHEDVKALGCLEPTHEPRATEHIDGMVAIIQQLIEKEHAYIASGSEGREVLFAIKSMVNASGEIEYGKLSGRKLEDQQAGARIAVEAHKRNPGDFVLWKESAADQPGWPASFRENGADVSIFGRPGWHIECSAMSKFHLGETFDIHGGGLDLIFPHHENEIAQSRCAHGTDVMANVWMHNGFLQVEGRKMSKSEGNFVTIRDNMRNWRGFAWNGRVMRLAMLKSDYQQPIDWTPQRLAESRTELGNWYAAAVHFENDASVLPGGIVCENVVNALCDNLNFSKCFAVMHAAAKAAMDGSHIHAQRLAWSLRFLNLIDERYPLSTLGGWIEDPNASAAFSLSIKNEGDDINAAQINNDTEFLEQVKQALLVKGVGVILGEQGSGGRPYLYPIYSEKNLNRASDAIENLMSQRLAFLAAKDFANADRIRNELLEQGIQLKDGKDPMTGERVTTWEVKR
jgi:cysteinyl-tRNA synthetase